MQIKCTLKEISLINSPKKKKYGMYLSSFFPIKNYGAKCWVVGVNIDVDYEKYVNEGMTDQEIVEGCIEYLNTPPKRKARGRPPKKPLYAFFHEKPYRFYIKESANSKYIQALLITNDKKNKKFWGAGKKIPKKRK